MEKFLKGCVGVIVASTLLANTALAGGILKRGNGSEPKSVDPQVIEGNWENTIVGDMFLGLLTEDAKGNLIPGLAESWSISNGGKTYTFKMRDAVWSDGTEITAHDFAYSFKRLLNPDTGAGYAYMLHTIKGALAYNEGKGKAQDVAVKAVDKDTLQVTLKEPTPYFLQAITHSTGWAVPKHVVEKHGAGWSKPENIVVSGPFKITEWVPNSRIKLVKNNKFYDATNVSLDGVEYLPLQSPAELKRWKAGELHTTFSIPAGQVDKLKSQFGGQVRVHPEIALYYYSINHKRFTDPNVRMAMNMTINRELITKKITADGQLPAYSFVPPGVNNYPDAAQLSFKTMSQSERVAKAKKLMAAAGYSKSNPLKVKISYDTDEENKKIAVAIASMWKEIGIVTTHSNKDINAHYADLDPASSKFDVGSAGWGGDYNDPNTFLEANLASNYYNYAGYNDPKHDALMEKAKTLTNDLDARAKVLKQAEQLALEAGAVWPIYYYVTKNMVSNKIDGWHDNTMSLHRSRWISIK